ncbi:MAG: TonB-dependent receptor [Bacteroidota bacterium]
MVCTQYFRTLLLCFLLLLSLLSPKAQAQTQDSLLLQLDRLDRDNVRDDLASSANDKVISGSRSERKISDLPFPIFVITGEEIRRNGYLTLADALKRLPGIRVSQPGSGIEGETFLMRGLQGNTYAKILINDIPIKPFVVSGMPLGANLPIREAERIEVIYGPAATLYGADASAGVINILLKESERPIYAQADLGMGANGFKNLDIMFGGKIGRDKRILQFKVYGSYTAFDDRAVKYDLDSLYNPETYQTLLQAQDVPYINRPNYRGGVGTPVLNDLPHLSSTLGVELDYRNWTLSFFHMTRRDHSSIGLSPYAVSYANPLVFFGERINTVQLSYQKTINKLQLKANLNTLWYRTDDQSSYRYVVPNLSLIQISPVQDSLNRDIDELYFSGNRFSSASSGEVSAEILLSYPINKNIELAGGFTALGGTGDPLANFNRFPPNSVTLGNNPINEVIQASSATFGDISAFVESYINYEKWNIILGAQVFSRQTDYLQGESTVINPRLAIQHQFSDQFSLRFSSGRSLRYPSPFFLSNSYTVNFNNLESLETGADLIPEETFSAELGSRWKIGKKVSGDLSFFYTRTNNLVNYAIEIDTNDINRIRLGYSNDNDSFAALYGIQSGITFKNLISSIGLSGRFNVNYTWGEEQRNISSIGGLLGGAEEILVELDDIRSQPDWIVQLDVEFRPFRKTTVLLENTFMTESLTQNTILYQFSFLADNDQLFNSGYYTLDLNINYQISKNLAAFFKINNVFNTEYAGIDAAADADGLIYNPQSLRISRLGINYRME